MMLPEKQDINAYKICLSGASLDTGNLGVSALGASLVSLVLSLRLDSKIFLCISHRDHRPQNLRFKGDTIQIEVVNCRLSPRSALQEHALWILLLALSYRFIPLPGLRRLIMKKNKWLRTINQANFLGDVRGGDSFSDIYGLRKLMIGIIPILVSLTLTKDLILLPQTYGPYKSLTSQILARFVLKRARVILTRDKESIETVEQLLGRRSSSKEILFCPDVAFTLEPEVPDEITVEPAIDFTTVHPLIGININGLMYNGGYTRANMFGLKMDYRKFVVRLLSCLLRETSAHILLVPHTFGDPGNVNSDPDASRDAMNSPDIVERERIHLVTRQYDQHEIKGIIGKCDFFIGSRMHSCIAALSQGIPTVGVAYSKKFIGVFNSVGFDDMVVDARSFDIEPAVEKIMSIYIDRDESAIKIRESMDSVRKKVIDTFTRLLDYGDSTDAAS